MGPGSAEEPGPSGQHRRGSRVGKQVDIVAAVHLQKSNRRSLHSTITLPGQPTPNPHPIPPGAAPSGRAPPATWRGRSTHKQGGRTHVEAPDAGSCLASPDHLCQHPHLLDLRRHLLRVRELLERSGHNAAEWGWPRWAGTPWARAAVWPDGCAPQGAGNYREGAHTPDLPVASQHGASRAPL